MQEEMDSLQDRKVWNLVNLPPGCTPVKGRWVYVVKSDGQHKAHFVAKGFTQIYGIDFKETFSPVARFESVQLLLFIAALNVKTAVMILFLGSALFLISSFHTISPFLGSFSYTYYHYLLILGPLTFTVHTL